MENEYILYVTFVASKIILRNPKRDASKNVPTPTVSEYYEILRANWIFRDDSNGEIRFVIRDLENKLWIFNQNYNFVIKITILPFFQKLEFLGSYNSSTINLSRNSVMHGRSKHINVRFHFLRDLKQDETIKLDYC